MSCAGSQPCTAVLSPHRRFSACLLVGYHTVACGRHPIDPTVRRLQALAGQLGLCRLRQVLSRALSFCLPARALHSTRVSRVIFLGKHVLFYVFLCGFMTAAMPHGICMSSLICPSRICLYLSALSTSAKRSASRSTLL